MDDIRSYDLICDICGSRLGAHKASGNYCPYTPPKSGSFDRFRKFKEIEAK